MHEQRSSIRGRRLVNVRRLRVAWEYEDSTREKIVLVTECGNGRPPRHPTDYYQIPPGPGRSQIFVDFPINNEEMHISGYVSHTQQSSVIRLLPSRQLLVLEERSGCTREQSNAMKYRILVQGRRKKRWQNVAQSTGKETVTKKMVMITHSPTLHIIALLWYLSNCPMQMLFCSHRESLLLSLPCYSPSCTTLHKYGSDRRRSLYLLSSLSIKRISTSLKRGRRVINAVLPKTECIAGKSFFVPSCMLWDMRM